MSSSDLPVGLARWTRFRRHPGLTCTITGHFNGDAAKPVKRSQSARRVDQKPPRGTARGSWSQPGRDVTAHEVKWCDGGATADVLPRSQRTCVDPR